MRHCLSAAIWPLLLPLQAFAIAPPLVSDEGLAKHPMLVVARWPHAPWVNRSKTSDKELREWELVTEIEIERVIWGDVEPGTHSIMIGFRLGWERHGGPLRAYWSTAMEGDIQEVTEPNLWFLQRRRSWKKEDPQEYLSLETYRGVQPLAQEASFMRLAQREAYFKHLASVTTKPPEKIHILEEKSWSWPVAMLITLAGLFAIYGLAYRARAKGG